MHNVSRLAGIFACAASLAAAGCAGSSGVTPMSSSATAGQIDTVKTQQKIYMPTVFNASKVQPQYSNAVYGGGALLYKPKMYLIFWGFKKAGDPDGVAPLLESYETSIGGSPYNNIYTQYQGSKKFIKNPKKQSGGFWMDDKNAIPTSPTDSQVAAESLQGVKHFGYDANASYVVVTAHDHNISGFGTSYCAYHSSTSNNGKLVSYTNLPYIPDAGASCGAGFISPPPTETSANEGTTIVEGHEYGESVTDPNPPSGYYSNQWGEIGDICAWTDVENDTFGSLQFAAQPMWSNATSSCVHSYQKTKK